MSFWWYKVTLEPEVPAKIWKSGNPKNVVIFYMLLFFEPSLEPLGKLGFSTILDDSSSS